MTNGTRATQDFYDAFWPKNVPDPEKTRAHISTFVPATGVALALDAGCGTGICSLAMADRADQVVAVDISKQSLLTGLDLASSLGKRNVLFAQANLVSLPFADDTFNLIYSWGAVDHTAEPVAAVAELGRVLKEDGTIVLAVYLRTYLTPVHEVSRTFCLRFPGVMRRLFVRGVAFLIRTIDMFYTFETFRDDNPRIESQVEDWFFAPVKHFFSIEEMKQILRKQGLDPQVLCDRTNRFRSSSLFILKASKLDRGKYTKHHNLPQDDDTVGGRGPSAMRHGTKKDTFSLGL